MYNVEEQRPREPRSKPGDRFQQREQERACNTQTNKEDQKSHLSRCKNKRKGPSQSSNPSLNWRRQESHEPGTSLLTPGLPPRLGRQKGCRLNRDVLGLCSSTDGTVNLKYSTGERQMVISRERLGAWHTEWNKERPRIFTESFLPPALKYHTSEVISHWNSQQLNRFINTILSGQRETKNQGSYPYNSSPQLGVGMFTLNSE